MLVVEEEKKKKEEEEEVVLVFPPLSNESIREAVRLWRHIPLTDVVIGITRKFEQVTHVSDLAGVPRVNVVILFSGLSLIMSSVIDMSEHHHLIKI